MHDSLLVLMSFIPIAWLLLSLGVLKMPSYKACGIAVVLTATIAFFAFGMPLEFVGEAALEGTVYSIVSISWVIFAAVLIYNISLKTGALETMKNMLSSISTDRRIQALVIAFAFGGFLEAVAGFGTAVAIPAGILITMGFKPIKASVVCLIANTVPVAFGVLGVPIISLSEVTLLEVGKLAYFVSLQLFPFAVILPLFIVFIVTGSLKKFKGVLIVSVLSGLAFALGQTLTAIFLGVQLAAIIGAVSSLLVIIIYCKLFPIKHIYHFEDEEPVILKHSNIDFKEALIAWLPYILVLVFIVIVQVFPNLKSGVFELSNQFYFGADGKPIHFRWLTSGGTILLVAAVISGLVQGISMKEIGTQMKKTIKQLRFSIITIVFVVSLAKLMTYSGMVNTSASFLAQISGQYFPLIAPFIGALGTFLTGSDTSSNILFGGLQKQTALQLNLDPYWIAAANGSGATAGKMISPQSFAIASSATNGAVKESEMLRATFKYCLLYVVLMGLLVYFVHI